LERRVVVNQIGHFYLSVFVHLHFEIGSAVFHRGASGSAVVELHIVGVDFDFGSQIGVAHPGGEATGNGFHKLGHGGGSCGVGSQFGDFDFSVVDGFFLVIEGSEGIKKILWGEF